MIQLNSQVSSLLENRVGKKIVFTNGCFDILHFGHVHYLNEAKELGDILIIGLNSDTSVKNLKGNQRPLNGERERKYILENLKAVSAVQIFSEQTPIELLKVIKPDVFVKGGDYSPETLPEYEMLKNMGTQVKILSFQEGYSTTSLINKIK